MARTEGTGVCTVRDPLDLEWEQGQPLLIEAIAGTDRRRSAGRLGGSVAEQALG